MEPSNTSANTPDNLIPHQAVNTTKAETYEEYIGHLAAIVESCQDAIISTSLVGVINSWNTGSEKMFGYSSKEAVGQHISLLIPPELELTNEPKNILERILNDEIFDPYETVRIKKNGEQLFVSITESPLRDRSGNTIGFSQIARDITSRKKTEAELIDVNKELACQIEEKDKYAAELVIANHDVAFLNNDKGEMAAELAIANKELACQNEEKHKQGQELMIANNELSVLNIAQQALFASIVDSSDDAILTKTLDGIITSWNKGAEKIFGYRGDEVIGQNICILIPYRLQKEEGELIKRIIRGEKVDHYETERLKKDGTIIFASISISPIKDARGNITGASKILRDITERVGAARELETTEQRFRALIENNQATILFTDESLKTIYRSPSTARITGWTDEEMNALSGTNLLHLDDVIKIKTPVSLTRKKPGIPQPYLNPYQHKSDQFLLHPDDIIKIKTAVSLAIQQPGIPQPYLARYQHKIGHYIWLEGTVTKLPDESIVKGLVFNSHDVTQRIELVQLLHKANALARIGSWEVDLSKGTVFWNDITRELHEAENDYIPELATSINFFKEGSSRELIIRKIKEAIEFCKPWDEEIEIVTAKGNVRWIRTIGEPELANNKCVRIYGSFQDIDKEKKAEQKLVESEKLYRNLFTNLLHGFAYCKAIYSEGRFVDYTYLVVNNQYEELTGLKDITGKNMSEVLPDLLESDPGFRELLNRVCLYGKSENLETYVASLNEWFSVSIYSPAQGYFVSLVDNITQRKQGEQGILESEETYRMLFESINDSVIVAEVFDDHSFKYLRVNDVACERYGYTREEFLAVKPPEIDSKHAKKTAMERLRKNLTIKNRVHETEHITKDGHTFPVEISSHTFTIRGKTVINCVIRDISDRKKANDEIGNTTDQLRKLTAHLQTIREEERKRIAREIHDELGQQLTAIKMDTVWIDKQIHAKSSAVKNKLQNIIELLDRGHQSVKKILNELRPAVLDDDNLLRTLHWQGQQFTESSNTPVYFTTNRSTIKLPPETATCIYRVYQESLTNIMRYAAANKVQSSLNLSKGMITLTIKDDGKGFNVETAKGKDGFGLLGMKERVYSLKGKFNLISSPGKGTKIVVCLPCVDR